MLCEKLDVGGEPSEGGEARDVPSDKAGGGLRFDQILSEVVEKVVEVVVVLICRRPTPFLRGRSSMSYNRPAHRGGA